MDGRRRALIIASDEYDHPGLSRLMAPAADAAALASVLGDREVGDFQVDVVHNAPAHIVQGHIEDLFADSLSDDLVLLHFSGHGLKSDSGELFFAARNTRPDRLGSTAVPADFVQRCMRSSRARSVVLFLDCCYGGAFGEGVAVRAAGSANVLESFPAGRLGGGRGRAVITASSAMEYAFEGNNLADEHQQQPSVFTAALVEGLASGDADRDEDGLVSLNELYDYVYDQVRERNPKQTPGRDVELQGELYLARSRRRRLHASPIPADVAAALKSDNMFTRLGAVTELRARMLSADLSAALGAYQALLDVSRSDIKYLQDAASDAMESASASAQPAELHFGTIPATDLPATRTIHLSGPPITTALAVEQSEVWVTVTVATSDVQVSLDTARTGRLAGTVTLTGPTCRVVIPVTAEVVPAPTGAVGTESDPRGVEVDAPTGSAPAADQPAPAAIARSETSANDATATPLAEAVPAGGRTAEPAAAPSAGSASVPRKHWRRSGVAALVSGAMLLGSNLLTAQSEDTTSGTYEIAVTYLLLFGLVVLTVGSLTLTARWRLPGMGSVLGASAVGAVVAVDMVRLQDTSDPVAGVTMAFVAQLVLIAAAIFAALGVKDLQDAGLAPVARSDWASWCVLVLAVAGALTITASASDISGDEPGLRLETALLAVLAVLIPLGAVVVRPLRVGRGLLLGWCLACTAPVLAIWLNWNYGGESSHGIWFVFVTLAAMAVLTLLLPRSRERSRPVHA